MRDHVICDDFGRRTTFHGEKLINESTDTVEGTKPQWLDVDVWRTKGGSFVVKRTIHYRVRHMSESCSRAEGYEIIPATVLDTYPCPTCWPKTYGDMSGGYGQADRITVEAYRTPEELITSFQLDGRYSNLARTILADLSEQDESIDAAWNTVVVP